MIYRQPDVENNRKEDSLSPSQSQADSDSFSLIHHHYCICEDIILTYINSTDDYCITLDLQPLSYARNAVPSCPNIQEIQQIQHITELRTKHLMSDDFLKGAGLYESGWWLTANMRRFAINLAI